MATLTDAELLYIVNELIVDKHISTTCADFIPTCYDLFYNTTSKSVTFTLDSTSYTIPNLAQSQIDPVTGTTDPENTVDGALGKFYFNTSNKKLFFKSTNSGVTGWKLLFQYIFSPNEEDTLDNVTKLLINTENVVSTYYDIFYEPIPKDVTIQLYDSNGILQTYTIPNRAKAVASGLYGTVNPENSVTATIGRIYVNTTNSKIFTKTTTTGNTGWIELLDNSAITTHNTSATAHQGYLARLTGDANQTFSVAYPTADSHAVNLGYTGNLTNLTTTDKSSFVNAINELDENIDDVAEEVSKLTKAPVFCLSSGNVDIDGNADLISYSGSTLSFKVGTTYPNITAVKTNNHKFTLTSLNDLSVSSLANGTYNLFVEENSNTVTATANTIYRQKVTPATPASGDIWLNTSLYPIEAKAYSGSAWTVTNLIPIGSATVSSGAVTSVKTLPYNNHFNNTATGIIPADVIETYVNGTSWYRLWSNGWLEQGGQITATGAITFSTLLLKQFKDTNYHISATNSANGYAYFSSKATTEFTLTLSTAGTTVWKACGYTNI